MAPKIRTDGKKTWPAFKMSQCRLVIYFTSKLLLLVYGLKKYSITECKSVAMGGIGWRTGFTEVHCIWKHNTGLQRNTSNSSMLNVVNSDLLSECSSPEHETDFF